MGRPCKLLQNQSDCTPSSEIYSWHFSRNIYFHRMNCDNVQKLFQLPREQWNKVLIKVSRRKKNTKRELSLLFAALDFCKKSQYHGVQVHWSSTPFTARFSTLLKPGKNVTQCQTRHFVHISQLLSNLISNGPTKTSRKKEIQMVVLRLIWKSIYWIHYTEFQTQLERAVRSGLKDLEGKNLDSHCISFT